MAPQALQALQALLVVLFVALWGVLARYGNVLRTLDYIF